MCGIFCCVCVDHGCEGMLLSWNSWKSLLLDRGPNSSNHRTLATDAGNRMEFFASILWHQGSEPCVQPCEDLDGNLLLWNGDVFSGLEIPTGQSDSAALLPKLCSAEGIFREIESIRGPGSFIYWQRSDQKLWFARDWCGRRSLTLALVQEDTGCSHLVVSSLCPTARTLKNAGSTLIACVELPAGAVYCVDLNSPTSLPLDITVFCEEPVPLEHIPDAVSWREVDGSFRRPFEKLNTCLPTKEHLYTKHASPIVSLSQVLCFRELSTAASTLLKLLEEAVRVRTSTTIGYCRDCLVSRSKCSHCRIGVLFSGGLDSTVLAALCHRCVPLDQPIDLFNVVFVKDGDLPGNAPDRGTGQQAFEELTSIHPDRTWNFVAIDVDKAELEAKREERIRDLIHPCNSVLDDSIGCALWFAARGEGSLVSSNRELLAGETDYVSPARVVILGMGADEQLGGYARHRRVANDKLHEDYRSRLAAVNRELATEMARIGIRNLGRDNRIVADHGREGRFPFLDESVHSFFNTLPVDFKLLPNLPLGVGDKIVLRFMASELLELKKTAWEPKRAIQFGSRIAKLENSKEKGNDVCRRL